MNVACLIKHQWSDWYLKKLSIPGIEHSRPGGPRTRAEDSYIMFRVCARCGQKGMRAA